MVVYKHLDQNAAFSISQRKSKIEMLHLSKKWFDIEIEIPHLRRHESSDSGSLKAKS